MSELFGFTVIESSWLPPHIMLLRSGRELIAYNTQTGEMRKMEVPDPREFLTAPIAPPRASEG